MIDDFAVPPGCAPERVEIDPRGFRRARFSAAELAGLGARLATRGGQALAELPLERRLAAWQATLDALADPDAASRQRLLPALVATSRLSPEGLVEGLRLMLEGAGGGAALALAERAAAARAPARLPWGAAVLAGNLPGLALQAVLPALLAGRPLLVKSAREEPLFAPALVAALAAVEPALGEAFAAVAFAGDDDALCGAALAGADRVVAYGGAEAIEALAARFGERLIAQGPKASVALVGRDADLVGAGRALARDVALYDQRGCLSVHAVYTDADARELGAALAWGLALEHGRLPPGPLEPAAAAGVQQLRGAADLAGRLIPRLELAQGTVVIDPEPRFVPSPGLRTVRVHPVRDLAGAVAALAPWRGRLQGAALAGAAAWRQAEPLAALGVSRAAAAGRLQAADATWANAGVDPLVAFGPTGGRSGRAPRAAEPRR